jgi:hypothetical protein
MGKVARITAIVLIVLGILVILVGFAFGFASLLRLGFRPMMLRARGTPMIPMTGVAGVGAGLLVLAVAFIQGLLMVAWGEGLYLLSKIAKQIPTGKTAVLVNPEPTKDIPG